MLLSLSCRTGFLVDVWLGGTCKMLIKHVVLCVIDGEELCETDEGGI